MSIIYLNFKIIYITIYIILKKNQKYFNNIRINVAIFCVLIIIKRGGELS